MVSIDDLNDAYKRINPYIEVVVKGFPPTKRGCILNILLNFSF